MKQRVLGSLARRRRSNRASSPQVWRRGDRAPGTRKREDRRGRKGNGCSRPHQGVRSPGTWPPGAGPERQAPRSFRACAPTGPPSYPGSQRGDPDGVPAGAGVGLEEEGRGKGGPPRRLPPAPPSARPRLVTLGRGRTPGGSACRSSRVPHDDRHLGPKFTFSI